MIINHIVVLGKSKETASIELDKMVRRLIDEVMFIIYSRNINLFMSSHRDIGIILSDCGDHYTDKRFDIYIEDLLSKEMNPFSLGLMEGEYNEEVIERYPIRETVDAIMGDLLKLIKTMTGEQVLLVDYEFYGSCIRMQYSVAS